MFAIYFFETAEVRMAVSPLTFDGAKNMFPDIKSGQAINLLPLAIQLVLGLTPMVVFFDGFGKFAAVYFTAAIGFEGA